jgi:hypothetical protein
MREKEVPPVDSVSIALIIAAVWIGLLVMLVVAMCKASAQADADAERHLAERRDEEWSRSPAAHSAAAVGDDRRSIDAPELEREAERLGIRLPERPRPQLARFVGTHRPHLARFGGTRRHRS